MTTNLATIGRVLASARTRAALSLGVVMAVGATGTFAYWTDSVTVSGTTFTAGTIDLQVNGANSFSGYTSLSLASMVPGNTVAGTLVIKNNGTAPMKYTATSTTTSASATLSGAMAVTVTGASTVTGSSPSSTCGGTTLPGAATTLGGSGGAALLSTGRQLAAGASETICIQVGLPSTAASSLQGATSDVTFTFTGTSDLS